MAHVSARKMVSIMAIMGSASLSHSANEISPQISERNMLLPPNVEVELSVEGSSYCLEWVSDREDLVRIMSTECDVGLSVAVIRTSSSLEGPRRAFVTAQRPSLTSGEYESNDDAFEPLVCKVNVAEVHSLQILTVTRRMVPQEFQWIQASLY